VTVVCSDGRPEDERDLLAVDVERWRTLAFDVLAEEGGEGELTLSFVGRDEIADLNREHMGKQGSTDVLSFPLDEQPAPGVPTLLGDVVVSPAVALDQFADHAGTIDDELALLVVHGILHVLGHDHRESEETARMRDRESMLLRRLHWRGEQPAGFRDDQNE
jgi:probable rRNA maturation factor